MDKPQDIEGKCARCGAEFMGRTTEKWMEEHGMRKVNGEWICAFCSGLGMGGLRRKEGNQP